MAESSNLNEQKPPVVSDDHTAKSTADAAAAPSSNPGSEASPETVMSVNTPAFIPETSAVILERLARQVEYYFSTANLERDTYVSTLRSLNDGYVPLAIIANFGKVKAMVSYDALNAVRRAAMDFSELLEVVHIDTQTGKRLDAEAVSTSPDIQTVEAVGPRSGEPIPMSSIVTAPVSSPVVITQVNTAPSVQNTLIIREVPEGTQESHIRELFTFEKCPQIQSLHLDVANCWFVTLDTLSKDDMINVMFELRTKKFASGDTVKARLKSAVVMNTDVSPVNYGYTNEDVISQQSYAPQQQGGRQHGGNKKMEQGGRKKKNSPTASNKGKNSNAQNKTAKGVKSNGGNTQRRNNNNSDNNKAGTKQNNKKGSSSRQDGRANGVKVPPQAPPTLGEDHFPSLPGDDLASKNKIEVEKVPDHRPEDDDMDKARGSSDSASTATTTSSSSSSKNAHQPIGYAAALLKAAPPMKAKSEETKMTRAVNETSAGKKGGNTSIEKKGPSNPKDKTSPKSEVQKTSVKKPSTSQPTAPSSLSVQAPSWGGGRSFADALRSKEAAAAVARAPGQLS